MNAKKGLLGVLVAVSATMLTAGTQAAGFTAAKAPDATSKTILQRPVLRLDEGAVRGLDPGPAIRRNFPQVIEQNFARLNEAETAKLMASLTEQELSDLAQLYVNRTAEQQLPARLLNVLAHRLPAKQLGRLSKHFGHAAVSAAVSASAPVKMQAFLAVSNTGYVSPTPGDNRYGINGRYSKVMKPRMMPMQFLLPPQGFRMYKVAGPTIDQTIVDIYLEFRTAPTGALSVAAALYETAEFVVKKISAPFGVGFMFGTYFVAPLIEIYAPTLWNDIGGTIDQIIENLKRGELFGSLENAANAERATAETFGADASIIDRFTSGEGDYGSGQNMLEFFGGSGGGRPIEESVV